MKVRNILYLLSLALIIYLLGESVLQIDIAPSKNQHLTNFNKNHVDTLRNIYSVKSEAKHWIDINHWNFSDQSRRAENRIILLVGLLASQVVLIIINRHKKT